MYLTSQTGVQSLEFNLSQHNLCTLSHSYPYLNIPTALMRQPISLRFSNKVKTMISMLNIGNSDGRFWDEYFTKTKPVARRSGLSLVKCFVKGLLIPCYLVFRATRPCWASPLPLVAQCTPRRHVLARTPVCESLNVSSEPVNKILRDFRARKRNSSLSYFFSSSWISNKMNALMSGLSQRHVVPKRATNSHSIVRRCLQFHRGRTAADTRWATHWTV